MRAEIVVQVETQPSYPYEFPNLWARVTIGEKSYTLQKAVDEGMFGYFDYMWKHMGEELKHAILSDMERKRNESDGLQPSSGGNLP